MFDLIDKINDINIRYRYKPSTLDNDTLIIVFSGFGKNGGYTYDFRNALNNCNSAIIWIEDSLEDHISYYLGKGISENVQKALIFFIEKKLKELEVEKDHCIFLGCSKGGSAALYYGIKCNFKNIVVTVPQFKIYSYIAGKIPVWKGHPQILEYLTPTPDRGDKLDQLIINELEKDNNLNKNIYLLTSSKDDQFLGQIQPYIKLLSKYNNFNLLLSESILVNKHTDVTKYNASLIVGLLSLMEKKIYPYIGNTEYKGKNQPTTSNLEKPKLFIETHKVHFKNNRFFIEGIAFFEGMSCAQWADIEYNLFLEGETKIEILPLAKTNKPSTTERFSRKSRVNYDKANFCTIKHQGLDLDAIPKGKYIIKINVKNNYYEESRKLQMDGLKELYSQDKKIKVYSENNNLILEVCDRGDIEFEQRIINNIVRKFGKLVKSWLYKSNFVANHFNIKGFNFIIDIIHSPNKNIEIYFFDKDYFFVEEIENFFQSNGYSYILINNKIKLEIIQFEEAEDTILEIVEGYLNFIEVNLDEKIFYNKLNEINKKKLDKLKLKEKKVIGFMVSDLRKWNLGDYFNILKNSNFYEPKIILLREKITASTQDDRYIEQINYFKAIDKSLIERESMSHIDFHKTILKEIDIIFYQQPWDGIAYWVQKLYKNILSCYIPYSYIIYNSHLDYSIKDFHRFMWKYFAQSTQHISTYLSYEKNHLDKIEVIGYPKLDVYQKPVQSRPFTEKFGNLSKKKIIYAPHHSFNGSALQIGTFQWNGDFIKELKEKENSLWCLKPHGRFRHSVISHQIMTETEIDDYLNSWKEKNSFLYDSGDYFDLFRDSDILITDCSSFLAEYFPTGKPIIWLKSANSKVEFNDFGKYISQGFYIVNNLEELKNIYKKLVIDSIDPLKDIRHEIISQVFQNEESSSEKLYNIINKYLDFEV